jgi:hypothetical protein
MLDLLSDSCVLKSDVLHLFFELSFLLVGGSKEFSVVFESLNAEIVCVSNLFHQLVYLLLVRKELLSCKLI